MRGFQWPRGDTQELIRRLSEALVMEYAHGVVTISARTARAILKLLREKEK
jgi:hypothetical protein